MTRDQHMRLRQQALEALNDQSEAVREAARFYLMTNPEPKERADEERLRND